MVVKDAVIGRGRVTGDLSALRRRVAELEGLEAKRARLEKALRASGEKYRSLVNNVQLGVFRVTPEPAGRFLEVNPAMERIFGYSRDELLKMTVSDLYVNPGDRVMLTRELSSLGRVEKELYQRKKDGSEVVILATITAVRGEGGEVKYFDGISEDITERKRMERELQRRKEELELQNDELQAANEELRREITERKRVEEGMQRAAVEWRTTFDAITDLVSIHDRDFRLLRVNKAFANAFKAKPAELIGSFCCEVVHGTDGPVPNCPHKRTLKTGESVTEEFYDPHRGAYFEVATSPIFNKKARVVASVHVARDVTRRKIAEEALRESEERYRALVNLGSEVGEAVIMLQDTEQAEAIHVFVSDQWARTTGYSGEELCAMSFFDLVHPDDAVESKERHRRRMWGEVIPGLYELSIVRKDGAEVPIELTGAYTTYKGRAANVIYIRDITERKQMEQHLVITDRLASVGELASGIAHELNNPLTSVIGFSQLLLDRDIAGDIKEDVSIISNEAQRAAGVVKNLLTFARKHPQLKGLVNINNIIEKVLEIRDYEQKVNNIRVKTRFAADLPEVMVDYFQLQQVFLNIVINAEYFMVEAHNEGTLMISTEKVDDVVRVSFVDDGPGIPEADLGHVFDPFFTTKEAGKGTGLGLSICHGIVAEHRGQIYAASGLGRGTTFTVELPVS